MLTCKEWVARSSDYLDDQMNLGQRLLMRQHLLFCRNCQRFMKQMNLAQATLKALPPEPEADVEALAERLVAEHKHLSNR